jgi:hypothetical protein
MRLWPLLSTGGTACGSPNLTPCRYCSEPGLIPRLAPDPDRRFESSMFMLAICERRAELERVLGTNKCSDVQRNTVTEVSLTD